MTFPIEFTHAFLKNVFLCKGSYICKACTLAHAVHHFKSVAVLRAVQLTFGEHQIGVSETEEGIVSRIENRVTIWNFISIFVIAVVFVQIVVLGSIDKLDAHIALLLVGEVLNIFSVFTFIYKTTFIV